MLTSTKRGVRHVLWTGLFVCFFSSLSGAEPPTLTGRVLDPTGAPLTGVELRLDNAVSVFTDAEGRYRFAALSAGNHTLKLRYFGHILLRREIVVASTGEQTLDFALDEDPRLEVGLVVASTRTGSIAEANLSETRMQRIRASVTGELLREIAGVDAVRRGPVGLDPIVRGLRETQVGLYLDDSRMFPAGPGRMDSGLSHLDPSAIARIQVVKGPYALTWGAGNMSAIRAFSPDPLRSGTGMTGTAMSGYSGNLESVYGAASVMGRNGDFGYWAHAVSRESGDYEDGDGNLVPGDVTTRELRLKLAWTLADDSSLTLAAGRQEQRDIDYPGRLLNADFFDTDNLSLTWRKTYTDQGLLRGIEAKLYDNRVDHGMGNWEKPTAEPNPNRIPPFGLDVDVATEADVQGGRLGFDLAPGAATEITLGADFYGAHRDALRTIARADTGNVLFADRMWPDTDIDDLGLFASGEFTGWKDTTVSGTLRLDLVETDAGETSAFFREHAGEELAASETNLSGSLTLARSLSPAWRLGIGLGSVVRTADATERYSDRIPSTKAQTSAEFMGNPLLDPERANQVDMWLEGVFPTMAINLNAFYREIDDFITLEPTDLPKRLPLSPSTVYRYINGEARFYGGELSLQTTAAGPWQAGLSAAYLHGQDETLDEPALGIAPLSAHLDLRYLVPRFDQVVLLRVHAADEQDRVAGARFETPTDGYVTADLVYSVSLMRRLTARLGVDNLADEAYVNHLNAKNPFTGQQIAEPGRVFHIDLRLRF